MKILLVHLLRLGDVISISPIIKGLIDKHPDSQVHLLINREAQAIVPLLPSQIKVRVFDRTAVQDGLGNAQVPTAFSVNYLHSLVQDINGESYDLVVNLTQNRFSGKLMSLFRAERKMGMEIDENERVRFHSSWFEYLNSPHSLGQSRLHYIDVFRRALRIHDRYPTNCLRTTPQGELEAEPILSSSRETICIQATSSEGKKCWSLESLAKYIDRLSSLLTGVEYVVLCAPGEVSELREWKAEYDLEVTIFPCSIPAAYSVLKAAKLLLTPDTSIKHLAAMADTPTIEISIGSSDPKSLGSYRNGSLILQSKVHCAPCSHSVDCHRAQHYCEIDIDPEFVAVATQTYLGGNRKSLESLAQKRRESIDILVTEIDGSAAWGTRSLSSSARSEATQYFNKLSWRLHLDFNEKQISEVGSEAISFSDYMKKSQFKKSELESLRNVRFRLNELISSWLERSDSLLSSDINGSEVERFNQQVLAEVAPFARDAEYYQTELAREISHRTPFILLKQTRNRLRSLKERLEIESRVLDMTLKRIEEKHEKEC